MKLKENEALLVGDPSAGHKNYFAGAASVD